MTTTGLSLIFLFTFSALSIDLQDNHYHVNTRAFSSQNRQFLRSHYLQTLANIFEPIVDNSNYMEKWNNYMKSLLSTDMENFPASLREEVLKENLGNSESLKRDINCGYGRKYIGSVAVDKCVGENCTISKMVCNGTSYAYGEYSGSISECSIRELACHKAKSGSTHLVKLNGNNCSVIMFNCNGVEFLPQEINDQKIYSCAVQVLCDNRVYGWDAFDYVCESDYLECNGVNVTDVNGKSKSDDCVIKSTPCKTFGPNSDELCSNITVSCSRSPTAQICINNVTDHRTDCVSSRNRCIPEKLLCGGNEENYSTFNGSLALCEGVKSVRCDNGVFELPDSDVCRILEISCNRNIENFLNQQKISDQCSIYKVVCLALTDLNCSSHLFGCNSDEGCSYVQNVAPCKNSCIQQGQATLCECPADRKGKNCEELHNITCSLNLVNPEHHCQESKYFGIPMCLSFKTTDKVTLTYKLNCSFNEETNYDKTTAENDGFQYGLITPYFATIEQPSIWKVIMKIFNFYQISDESNQQEIEMTLEHFLGTRDLTYDFDLSTFDKKLFMAGGSVYIEFKLLSSTTTRKHTTVVAREYIDITDYEPFVNGIVINTYAAIIGSVVGGIVLLLIVYGGYRFYLYRKEQEQDASDL